MRHLDRRHPRPSRWRQAGAALASLALLLWPQAHAQIADVVRPDEQGEFTTIRVAGPRGSSPQRFWLVVDRDPRGLICRDQRWRPWISLRYGSVVELDQPDRQLEPMLIQGKAYLRLTVQPRDIAADARLRERGRPAVCTVRASSTVLAPIQPDSLQAARVRP